MSQVDVAIRAGIALHRVSAVERCRPDVRFNELVSVCRAHGFSLVFEPLDGVGPSHDLYRPRQPQPRPTPEPASPSHVADTLRALASVATRLRPGHRRVIAVFDFAYADQVAELVWGSLPGIDDDFEELAMFDGLPVSLSADLGDVAVLVRDPVSARWPDPVAQAYVVPAVLTDGAEDVYAGLRRDGVSAQAALEMAELTSR